MDRFIYNNNNIDLKKQGVYSIIFKNKLYIGSTCSNRGFKTRFNHHKLDLIKNKHHSIYLQNSFNKYKDNLIFQIIEITNNCIKREQFYIDLLKPKFNSVKIAGSNKGYKKSKIQIENHRKSLLNYYKNNNPVNKLFNYSQIKLILIDIKLGLTRNEICNKYNMKKSTYYKIKNNTYECRIN